MHTIIEIVLRAAIKLSCENIDSNIWWHMAQLSLNVLKWFILIKAIIQKCSAYWWLNCFKNHKTIWLTAVNSHNKGLKPLVLWWPIWTQRCLWISCHSHTVICPINLIGIQQDLTQTCKTWWRHQMETFSALLAICVGNSRVPGEFPTQMASNAELWCFLWSAPE